MPDGTYTLAVRSVNANGSSTSSNAVTLTFPAACSGPPQTPLGVSVTENGNVVRVSWSLPSSGPAPTGYLLNVGGAFTGTLPTTARELTGAVPAGTYTLSVSAANLCGVSGATATQTVVVP